MSASRNRVEEPLRPQRAHRITTVLSGFEHPEGQELVQGLTPLAPLLAVPLSEALHTLGEVPEADALVCLEDGSGQALEVLEESRRRHPQVLRLLVGPLSPEGIEQAIVRADLYGIVSASCGPAGFKLFVERALEHYELGFRHRTLSRKVENFEDNLERLQVRLQERRERVQHVGELLYVSESMGRLCDEAALVARTELPVIIQGETGTGKELLARAVHGLSDRSAQPLMVQNCGAISDELMHSELFGHTRGAFTGAVSDRLGLFPASDGGTVFLDEVSELSPGVQASLLRFLQSGEVKPLGGDRVHRCDVRILTASNRPLRQLVRSGGFRSDLYFRLRGFELTIPPLRQRRADVSVLADHFATRYAERLGRRLQGFSSEAIQRLEAYEWPGNVRELEHEVQRMVALAENGSMLTEKHLSPTLASVPVRRPRYELAPFPSEGPLKEQVETLERRVVGEALRRHRWNQTRAAKELGLSRVGLANKIKRYELHPD